MSDQSLERALLPCPFCGHVGLSFGDGSTCRWGIASCEGCGATCGETRREYPDKGEWHDEAIKAWNTRALLSSPPAAPAGVEASLFKSKLFQMFLRQGFWHAHHVDLVWRYNGRDVHEEADWLKDVWYALRSASPSPAPAAGNEDAVMLDAFDAHPSWELSMTSDPDAEPDELWQVHRCSGGRNDREWTLIGSGATARDAIRAAMKDRA
jgi:hypothetical protein